MEGQGLLTPKFSVILGRMCEVASTLCGLHRIQGFHDGFNEWVQLHPRGPIGNISVPARESVDWLFEEDWGKASLTRPKGPHAIVRCYTAL